MKKIPKRNGYEIESYTEMSELWRFIKSAYDGIYLCILSIFFPIWAIVDLFFNWSKDEVFLSFAWLFFYPVLLFVIFIWQRSGTPVNSSISSFLCCISLSVASFLPIYIKW